MALSLRKMTSGIAHLSKEAVRRKVWISAGAYVAISIGVIEISQAVASALLFPAWTSRLVTFLLILGFPLVVVLAWIFDIGDGGLHRTAPADAEAKGTPAGVAKRTRSEPTRIPGRAIPKLPAARARRGAIVEEPAGDDEAGAPPDPERVRRAALGHVRHELRTPINAILGYSEMLLEDEPPGDAAEDLARIRDGGRQLLGLVDSILDAGRIASDSGRDVESYAAQIEADLRTPITSVVGYCEMLIEGEAEAGRTAMTADLERILRAARSLLETSGDIVRVAGEAGSATRVTDSSAMASGVLAKLRPVAAGDSDGEGSLLVVDDNETNRDLLTRQLARHGYMVATAKDGAEALEQMERQEFDLVLLDVIMPNMDGVEALKRIKADERLRDTSVIMLSSIDEVDSAVRCLQLGAEEYLSKPVEGALLEARIRANLEVRHLRTRERLLTERLAADQAILDGLVTRGIPASMAARARAGAETVVETWPSAAALCLVLDPVPFGAGAMDEYVAFLADAMSHFEDTAADFEDVAALVAGRSGLIAASFGEDDEAPVATALADLARDFLAGLAVQDPAAVTLFRGGLHAGPMIGSLLASPRPRFDLWGEAVDTARSVAELADPGSVLVTPPARSLLDEEVGLDSVGVRDVGTRGSMRLHRLKDRTAV
jgi:CheY-like chemotaxis protein